jgi:hypothetical protein
LSRRSPTKADPHSAKEKEFKKWVKREDVMAELNAQKEPGGLTDEAIKEIVEKLNLM